MTSITTNTVRLVVYDISGGMARQLGSGLLGFDLDCVPHTGILVFGQEYFFGGGIQRMPHEDVIRQFGIAPMRREVLGMTEKSASDFHAYLDSISSRFTQSTYDVFRNNCNHFSDTAVRFLLNGTGIPAEIVNLPDRILATPMGQMLAPTWSSMQQQMQNQFVPFNTAAPLSTPLSRPAGAPVAAPATSVRTIAVDQPKTTLVESIKGLNETCSPKDTVVALDTLAKILKNIIGSPHEEKFRRLSLQNERFHAALGQHKHGLGCLVAVGFIVEPTGTHVLMTPDPAKWEKLLMSEKIISAARKKAIKTYVEKSNITSSEQAYGIVDRQDPLVQEVVKSMFPS